MSKKEKGTGLKKIRAGTRSSDRVMRFPFGKGELRRRWRKPDICEEAGEAIFSQSSHATLICNSEHTVLQSNKVAEDIFRFLPGQLNGSKVTELFTVPFQQKLTESVRTLLASTLTKISLGSHEFPVGVRKGGDSFYLDLDIIKIVGDGDRRYIINLFDIGEEVQGQQLKDMQAHILEVLAREGSEREIFSVMFGYLERFVPGMLCSVLRYNESTKTLHDCYSPHLPPEYRTVIEGIGVGPAVGSCGTAVWHKKRVTVTDTYTDSLWKEYVEVAKEFGLRACWSQPILAGNGKVLGTFAMYYREVREPDPFTLKLIEVGGYLAGLALERTELLGKMKVLNDQAFQAQKLDAMGKLAGGIAHDLNNTIAAMYGELEVLRLEGKSLGEGEGRLATLFQGCERAASLTRQLLGFARKGSYHLETVSVSELVEDAIKLFHSHYGRSVGFELGKKNRDLVIKVDPSQIKQALVNIFVNGAQAMNNQGSLRVSFTRSTVDDDAQEFGCISVTDTGTGIAEQDLGRLFDPFYTTRGPTEKLGLGLAMVEGVVQHHGGRVDVSSQVGLGSTFRLYLPLVEKISDEKEDEDKPIQTKLKGHLLLIDDEESVLSVMERILNCYGLSVTSFSDPQAAVDWYKDNHSKIDAAIIDMKMPKLEGDECFAELKKINKDLIAVIISGYAKDQAVQELLETGARAFFQKPFKHSELVACINSLFSLGSTRTGVKSRDGLSRSAGVHSGGVGRATEIT